MLSICIPTYNYDVRPLVNELLIQGVKSKFNFEILVVDDCSTNTEVLNSNLTLRLHDEVDFIVLDKNIGRSAIRNLLSEKAVYDRLLFLDCDTFPETSNFIKDYWSNALEDGVVVGGIAYRRELTNVDFSLRWHYGHARETSSAEKRSSNPYGSFMTGNFLITKSVFGKMKFDESITKYGHEDTLFGIELEKEKIKILHIDNRVYHDGLETNQMFIEKTKSGIDNLLELIEQHPLRNEVISKIKLLKIYKLVKKAGLVNLVAYWFQKNEKRMLLKIDSSKPNISSFDWYKLGYICLASLKR